MRKDRDTDLFRPTEPTSEKQSAHTDESVFEDLNARFDHFFDRGGTRSVAREYLRRLLALRSDHAPHDSQESSRHQRQRFLNYAHWDADAVRDELGRYVSEQLTGQPGVAVLDQVAFAKKGASSVGVERQRIPYLPKTINCRLGIFLTYVSPQGAAIVDRRLYLSEAWCADTERRKVCGVPEQVTFQGRPSLGLALVQRAWEGGLPIQWVASELPWANAPDVNDEITRQGLLYLLAIPYNQRVRLIKAPNSRAELGHVSRLVSETAGPGGVIAAARPAFSVAAQWPDETLQPAMGVDSGRWVCGRVEDVCDGRADQVVWLLVRRPSAHAPDASYYLSNAPEDIPLSTLVAVALACRTCARCLQVAQEQAGLADYEVRGWTSWHRHVTLSMLAYACLVTR